MLGIQNGKVAELALNNNAIIMTLDSDFLNLNRNLQTKSRIVYIKIHPRDPVKLRKIVNNFLKKYSSKLNNYDVVVVGDIAYVADREDGLEIIKIKNL